MCAWWLADTTQISDHGLDMSQMPLPNFSGRGEGASCPRILNVPRFVSLAMNDNGSIFFQLRHQEHQHFRPFPDSFAGILGKRKVFNKRIRYTYTIWNASLIHCPKFSLQLVFNVAKPHPTSSQLRCKTSTYNVNRLHTLTGKTQHKPTLPFLFTTPQQPEQTSI